MLITAKDLHEVILVGHSYGGMVITGVAACGATGRRWYISMPLRIPDNPSTTFLIWVYRALLQSAGIAGAFHHMGKTAFDPPDRNLPKNLILCTQSEFRDVHVLQGRKLPLRTRLDVP